MPKLNQLLAVRKGLRGRTDNAVTELYKQLQKPALYAGLVRTYQPRDDAGEHLPSERQLVQRSVEDDLQSTAAAMTKLFEVTASVDYTNQITGADVPVGEDVLIQNAPVSFLLFLEKQLTDFRTMVTKVPTLAPEEEWSPDHHNGGARSASVGTTRARKVPFSFEASPATDKHPAQVQVMQRDEIVGDWTLVKFSGAVSVVRRDQILTKIDTLMDAVRKAVEEANVALTVDVSPGEAVFDFLLAP